MLSVTASAATTSWNPHFHAVVCQNETLVKAAVECVEDGRIQFVPNRFTKTYTNWMDNIHDWCISRQIWWGHRILCGTVTTAESRWRPGRI